MIEKEDNVYHDTINSSVTIVTENSYPRPGSGLTVVFTPTKPVDNATSVAPSSNPRKVSSRIRKEIITEHVRSVNYSPYSETNLRSTFAVAIPIKPSGHVTHVAQRLHPETVSRHIKTLFISSELEENGVVDEDNEENVKYIIENESESKVTSTNQPKVRVEGSTEM